ncbi:hypothetical protein HDU93_005345, partial [Gonapodya sp. JEL0774]
MQCTSQEYLLSQPPANSSFRESATYHVHISIPLADLVVTSALRSRETVRNSVVLFDGVVDGDLVVFELWKTVEETGEELKGAVHSLQWSRDVNMFVYGDVDWNSSVSCLAEQRDKSIPEWALSMRLEQNPLLEFVVVRKLVFLAKIADAELASADTRFWYFHEVCNHLKRPCRVSGQESERLTAAKEERRIALTKLFALMVQWKDYAIALFGDGNNDDRRFCAAHPISETREDLTRWLTHMRGKRTQHSLVPIDWKHVFLHQLRHSTGVFTLNDGEGFVNKEEIAAVTDAEAGQAFGRDTE